MTTDLPSLTLEQFLALPATEIAKMTPKSMMTAPQLSRRGAILRNITDRNQYVQYCLQGWLEFADMAFRHGIQHLFVLHISPSNYKENTQNYRENLTRWINAYMVSDFAQKWYKEGQWRMRLLYQEVLPEFQGMGEQLATLTSQYTERTVWNMFVPDPDLPNRWMVEKLKSGPLPTNSQELISWLYGDAVPPIDLYLSFGKPIISPLPPLLAGKMHCYWGQFCTFDMTEAQFRAVLYDCIYTRATWRADKTDRTNEITRYRAAWDPGPIVGLGMRLGSFWYPQPTSPPPPPSEA